MAPHSYSCRSQTGYKTPKLRYVAGSCSCSDCHHGFLRTTVARPRRDVSNESIGVTRQVVESHRQQHRKRQSSPEHYVMRFRQLCGQPRTTTQNKLPDSYHDTNTIGGSSHDTKKLEDRKNAWCSPPAPQRAWCHFDTSADTFPQSHVHKYINLRYIYGHQLVDACSCHPLTTIFRKNK
jgi:hypothetical protein